MKYRIIDVRTYFSALRKEQEITSLKGSRYDGMIKDLFLAFLYNINAEFLVENTNAINVYIYDIAYKKEIENEIYPRQLPRYGVGTKGVDNIGLIETYIDVKHLLSLSDAKEINRYLVGWIHNTLKSYGDYFGENTAILDIAQEIITANDYFIQSSGKKVNKRDKTVTVWIESFFDLEKDIFRLAINDNISNKKDFFFIDAKKPWREIYAESVKGFENDIHYIIKNGVLRTFELDGWKKGNCFCFHWGDEKYVFDLNKKELKRD